MSNINNIVDHLHWLGGCFKRIARCRCLLSAFGGGGGDVWQEPFTAERVVATFILFNITSIFYNIQFIVQFTLTRFIDHSPKLVC